MTEKDLFPSATPQPHKGLPMVTIKASNTILYCKQWDACVHFYQDILKFRLTFAKDDWFRELAINAGAHLSVANVKHCTIPSSQGKGVTLSWQVEELESVREHLLAHDVRVSEIRSHTWRAPWFYAWDPEGNRIEFWR